MRLCKNWSDSALCNKGAVSLADILSESVTLRDIMSSNQSKALFLAEFIAIGRIAREEIQGILSKGEQSGIFFFTLYSLLNHTLCLFL